MTRVAPLVLAAVLLAPAPAVAEGPEQWLRPAVARNTQLTGSLPATVAGRDSEFPASSWDATLTPSLVVAGRTVATLPRVRAAAVTARPYAFPLPVGRDALPAVRRAAMAARTRRVVLHWAIEATQFLDDASGLPPRAWQGFADDVLSLDPPRRAARITANGATLTLPSGWRVTSPPGAERVTFLATYAGTCRADVEVLRTSPARLRQLDRTHLATAMPDVFGAGRGTVTRTRAWATRPGTDVTTARGLVPIAPGRYADVRLVATRYPSCPATFDDEPSLTAAMDAVVRSLRPTSRS